MWPLVAHVLLYPLVQPAAAWVWAAAGREVGDPPPWAVRLSLALYLVVAAALAAGAFLH